jgi:hypothetical protein
LIQRENKLSEKISLGQCAIGVGFEKIPEKDEKIRMQK